ncbi:MAG: HEAT repeat domain-containing protein [Actinomycetota bacterium]|nr:HEAT repeat domain-containing protein [Actinomycetota bacterium]
MRFPQPEDSSSEHSVSRTRQKIIEASLNEDLSEARENLDHPEPTVRATALVVLGGEVPLDEETLYIAMNDSSLHVRSTLAYLSSKDTGIPIDRFLTDEDSAVVEIACWASGERGEVSDKTLRMLQNIVEEHDDPLCRESAVAALGALGKREALSSILKAVDDVATVRRRAVLALSPFDGPAVDAAVKKALEDRDWQVRQAAEDIAK